MTLPNLKCPNCGKTDNMTYAEKDGEILGEMVKCLSCGWVTDWYEAHKAWEKEL